MDKAGKRNPGSLLLGERVSKLEGKVSILTQLNCVELSVLVMILLALISRAI